MQEPADPYDSYPTTPVPSSPVVPHSREAEESAIGCVLINQEAYFEMCDIINSNDFHIKRHQWIWDAFIFLIDNKIPIDQVTVSEELDRHGHLQEVGGSAYLMQLVTTVPNSLNGASYAAIIEKYSVRRKMLNKANKIAKIAYDDGMTPEDLLHEYDQIVQEDYLVTSSTDETQDSDEASLELLGKITGKVATGIRSSWPKFDAYEALGGLPVGGTLLIGDSSFGKSAWTLQLCEQVALAGNVALYIGLESTNAQMVIRRIGGASGVQGANKKLRTASLNSAEEFALINQITNDYQGKYGGRLKFNSRATSLKAVENAIRIHKPKVCVVDQISQITDMPTTNATLNLLANFTKLKALGNKYDCAVVVVHALAPEESREFFKKNSKFLQSGKTQQNTPPDINAIPWASQMKYLADVILFLVPALNQKLSGATKYEIIIWIMKDRDGSRFYDTWWDYDLVPQWFTDKDAPYKQSAQQPSRPMVRQSDIVDYSIPEPDLSDAVFHE